MGAVQRLGEWIYDHTGRVIVATLLLTLAALPFAATVFDIAKQGGFHDASTESGQVASFLDEHDIGFPNADDLVLVITAREGRLAAPEAGLEVGQIISRALADPMVTRVTSREALVKPEGLDAPDGTATLVLISMHGTDDEKRTYYDEVLEPKLRSEIVDVRHSGLIPGNVELTETVVTDLRRAELIALPITLVALLILFGGVVPALLPIIIAGISLALSWGLTRILGEWVDISVLALTPMSMLALGVGVDYSLFVVMRYREEMARRGDDVRSAVSVTSATAGRAVLLSGVTTAISLASLFIFNEMFLRSVAFGTVVAVFTGVTVATIMLPAIISALGRAARWPASNGVASLPRNALRFAGQRFDSFVRHDHTQSATGGFWFRMSRLGARWPLPLVTVVVVLLLAFGTPFLRINLTLPGEDSFPSRFEARQASAALDELFPDFERELVEVIVEFEDGVEPRAQYGALASFVDDMAGVPGVNSVDTFTTRLTEDEINWQTTGVGVDDITETELTVRLFTDANAAWLRVSIEPDESSAEARAIVEELRDLPPPAGATASFGGGAAELVDARGTLQSKVPIVVGYIVLVTLLALFIEFRSVLIPLKAVLLNGISIAAALGALVFVFQDGHLQNILRFEESGSIATAVPVLIFAIVFGLSMDYEIFMLSRIREEYDANGGDTEAAVSHGLQRTGRMITGAALLIVLVIGAFATSEIVIMKQIGFGLALAILLDATVVRALLVPASMQLMGPANWWAPRWLRRRERPSTVSGTSESPAGK